MIKIKHLVCILGIFVVVCALAIIGIQKKNSVANYRLLKTTYAYTSNDMPTGVNTYERKNQNPCAGKTCGCGNLPQCKTSENGNNVQIPAKGYFSCNSDPRLYSNKRVGSINYSPNSSKNQLSCVFKVSGANASDYTLITTLSQSVNLSYYHKNATAPINYCSNSDYTCRYWIFNSNQSRNAKIWTSAELIKVHMPVGACHIAKGSKIVKKLPFDACYQKDIILP